LFAPATRKQPKKKPRLAARPESLVMRAAEPKPGGAFDHQK
jgi:hypothetical protein